MRATRGDGEPGDGLHGRGAGEGSSYLARVIGPARRPHHLVEPRVEMGELRIESSRVSSGKGEVGAGTSLGFGQC
jgi:hypothetical protein